MSEMHDTCNTANLVAKKLAVLKQESGEEYFGVEGWASMKVNQTGMLDFLCANHTRNLHISAFNRLFKKYLCECLGTEFNVASKNSVGGGRLEMDGESLLRSMCKLAHDGHLAYEKGDGIEIKMWLTEHFPHIGDVKVGRAELSHRQDWTLEVSEKLLPLVQPLLKYLSETLVLDANTLRDSVLMRLELFHFDAFIFVSAVMWATVYDELRSLTNSKVVSLNPMELHAIYDNLWSVVEILRSSGCMDILAEDFRPWEKVKADDENVQEMYKKLDRKSASRRESFLKHLNRPDAAEYKTVVRDVFSLFGEGIQESLQRTMGEYLSSCGGAKASCKMQEWEKEVAKKIRSDNNAAERPFAIMRDILLRCPTMTLTNLGRLAHVKTNGTFRHTPLPSKTAETSGKAIPNEGAAISASTELKKAISTLCSIRRCSLGSVTKC